MCRARASLRLFIPRALREGKGRISWEAVGGQGGGGEGGDAKCGQARVFEGGPETEMIGFEGKGG